MYGKEECGRVIADDATKGDGGRDRRRLTDAALYKRDTIPQQTTKRSYTRPKVIKKKKKKSFPPKFSGMKWS